MNCSHSEQPARVDPRGRAHDRTRSGAALIIAIIVLAALLMLGLPFLFSQSSSLAGTRSFAHAQLARVGGATAEDLGAGAGSYVMQDILRPGSTTEATTLAHLPSVIRIGANRYAFDLSPRGLGFNSAHPINTAVIGTVLEDESGKLDPNHMDVMAWTRLFEKTGILDVDDGNGQGMDLDTLGQLAQALAEVRFDPAICPDGRITRLDQLLQVKPQPEQPVVRWPLTRAELQQLAPYLTLATLGQGRAGLIDLGTMISKPGANQWDAVLDAEYPVDLLAYPVQRDLIGAGSTVVSAKPGNNAGGVIGPNGTTPPKYEYGMATSIDLSTINDPSIGQLRHPKNHRPRTDEAVGVEVPAPVNIHQTTPEVRHVLHDITESTPASPTPNTPNGLKILSVPKPDALNRPITGFDLQNPLGFYDFLDDKQNGQTKVSQTQINDPNNGLSGMPNGTLTVTATWLHISGGDLRTMPGAAYGKIEGDENGQTVFEFISYRDSDPAGGLLREVRRGLNFPGSTGPHAFAAGAKFLFIAPRELPPLAVASQGQLTIEGGSTVSDAAGRQGAQRFRRIVMQTLPHEEMLEAPFIRQSQLHTLLVARNGSLVTSFPEPYIRLFNNKPPDTSDTPPAGLDPAQLDKATGLRPGSLRTLLSATHLNDDNRRSGHEWSRSFSMKQQIDDALSQGDHEYGPDTGGNAANLTPDGYTLNGPIAYKLHDGTTATGFLTSNPPAGGNGAGQGQGPNIPPELNGRQLGLWVRPNDQLTGTVTLLDLRMPSANAGQPLPGGTMVLGTSIDARTDQGDNYYQNRFNLSYESQSKQLVLTYCNGAIEHINDYGQICPSETYDFPNMMPLVDPRTLGDLNLLKASGGTFGSVQPGKQPLAAKRPLNLVQQRYQLSKTDGLKKGTWYLIQVAMVGNDPGHMAIIVNGVVGRDVTRMYPKSPACEYPGDHFTMPSLVLKTALPATPTLESTGAKALLIPRIELDAIAVDPKNPGQPITGPAAVAMILPMRGMIRIGNEYISYDNITGSALENCVRARRQNSIQKAGAGKNQWIALEHHELGDLVVPGGFRFNPGGGGHLWKGGCTLKEDFFPNGDPNKNYTVWAELTTPKTIDMASGLPVLLKDEVMSIKIQNGSVAFQDWPTRGYARLNRTGEIIYYDNGAKPTNSLNNIVREQFIFPPAMPTLGLPHPEGPGPGATAQDIIWPATGMPIPTITLLSFEVTGDPTGSYYPPDTNPNWLNGHLLQLYDTTTGRAEWIRYTKFDTSKMGYSFFLDRNAFRFLTSKSTVMNPERDYANPILGSSRGQQRTAFLPEDAKVDPNNKKGQFPKDTRVIPVQMDLPNAHFITTGDVLTIAPKQPSSTNLPYQVCVRHAATDGFSLTPGLVSSDPLTIWDTRNEYFAFTEALPDNYTINTFELLCWPGWSGNDLTPMGNKIDPRNNDVLPPVTTPWANAFAAGYASGGTCKFWIGGDDTEHSFVTQPGNGIFKGVIDALFSGAQPGGNAQPNFNDNVIVPQDQIANGNWNAGTLVYDKKVDPWITGTALSDISGMEVRASTGIFVHDLGLVLIGGEVFAYQRLPINTPPDSTRAELIGRGLLGSVPSKHRSYEPMLVLPIGPVGRIVQPLNAGQQEVRISTDRNKSRNTGAHLDSPAVLVSSADGSKVEVVGMPHRYTAPWLHGMYNSLPQGGFSPTNGFEPLAIGWWPRHPSALPNQSSQAWPKSQTDQAAALRCRSFSWIGYPLRFHDTYFNAGDQLADVSVLSDGDGVFTVKAMALDQGFDWTQPYANAMTLSTGVGYQDASQVFSRFDRKKLDGAELRVFWQYANQPPTPNKDHMGDYLDAIATAGNTAPMIGRVRLRCRAPTRVVQVEEAR